VFVFTDGNHHSRGSRPLPPGPSFVSTTLAHEPRGAGGQLAKAEQGVAIGKHIQNQYRIIAQLEQDGHATTEAIDFLIQLLETQEFHEAERDHIKAELEDTK
jgi:hypothetical protein